MFLYDAIFNGKTTEPFCGETSIKVSKTPSNNESITAIETYLCTSNKQLKIDCNDGGPKPRCKNISKIVPQGCKAYDLTFDSRIPEDIPIFDINLNPTSSSTNISLESYFCLLSLTTKFSPNNPIHYILDQQLYVIFGNATIFYSRFSSENKLGIACNNKASSDSIFIFELKDSSIIDIIPTIKRNYQSSYWGYTWGLRSYDDTCYLKHVIKSLPKSNNEGNIQFGVRVSNYFTYETESYERTLGGAIANLGGFYVALNSIYVLLFGMPKLSPWGIVQKYVLRCRICRRSLKTKLAKRYVSSSGIILSQKVLNRHNGATLEDRVQMLETMLQDYYLDNYQWEAKLKYNQLQIEYDKMFNSWHKKTEGESNLAQENDKFFDS
ncbi:11032_t:CDS:2 [Entrophospora sp. SA101]|nr:11032_t:CDS:2 [Entrophospora sp. SA101]